MPPAQDPAKPRYLQFGRVRKHQQVYGILTAPRGRAYAPLFQGLRTTFSCVFGDYSKVTGRIE